MKKNGIMEDRCVDDCWNQIPNEPSPFHPHYHDDDNDGLLLHFGQDLFL